MTTIQETEAKDLQFAVKERAIIYCRVSSDEQAESGTSLDMQEEKSLAYCEANNMQVVGVFRDDITGKFLDRPELNKVREMLRAGQADNLIVYKPNRLDRSEWGLNLLILMQELKTLGVSLHYSQDARRVDLHNPMEAFMYGSFAGWQAGEDHRETVTKLREGKIARVESGYVVPSWKPPFGYRKIRGDNKRWYFEIFEREAKIIRLIFELYVVGDESGEPLSLSKIAGKLNDLGIKPPRSNAWRKSALRFILTNENYCGTWHFNGIPVSIPAIVSRETWELAQEKIEENKRSSKRNRTPGRYLLAGRITCGDCGYSMTGRVVYPRGKAYRYYTCFNVNTSKQEQLCECHNPSFRGEVVDARVWNWIETIAEDEDKLREGLQGYNEQQKDKTEPIKRELGYVEEVIKEKQIEWDEEIENFNILTSKKAKAKKAFEIDQVEQAIEKLEATKEVLLKQLKEKSITEEQTMGILLFAKMVKEDIKTLRKAEVNGKDNPELKIAVHEAKRRLLLILDVQVILFVENGKKWAKVTAKMCPSGEVLSVEFDTTKGANYENDSSFTARQIGLGRFGTDRF